MKGWNLLRIEANCRLERDECLDIENDLPGDFVHCDFLSLLPWGERGLLVEVDPAGLGFFCRGLPHA